MIKTIDRAVSLLLSDDVINHGPLGIAQNYENAIVLYAVSYARQGQCVRAQGILENIVKLKKESEEYPRKEIDLIIRASALVKVKDCLRNLTELQKSSKRCSTLDCSLYMGRSGW